MSFHIPFHLRIVFAFAIIATSILFYAASASADGSDSATPYTVTAEGVTLPDGVTFPDGGHVNWTTTTGSHGIHFESLNNQPSGKYIGESFLPFDLAPGECVTWVQVSLYNEHFGEGGQEPVCAPVVTPPTDTPSDVPSDTPSDTPSDVPSDTPSDIPSDEPTPTDEPTSTAIPVPPLPECGPGEEAIPGNETTPYVCGPADLPNPEQITPTKTAVAVVERDELAATGGGEYWPLGAFLIIGGAASLIIWRRYIFATTKEN